VRILADLRPLREVPAYRRLWLGTGLSSVGSQMTSFAVALQIYRQTHSSLAVGGVGLATALPIIALSLVGGTVADAADRRRIMLAATLGQAVVSALLAAQAIAGLTTVWPLYALVAAASLLGALSAPASRAVLPRLVGTERVPAAAALNMLTMHTAVTAGPTLAGILTAAYGLKVCYLVDAASFAAALYGIARLPAMPRAETTARPGAAAILAGLRFVLHRRIVLGALLADVNATVLGFPFALFPAINAAHFGGGATTLGLLNAAPAVGGVLGSALSGPVRHVSRRGVALLAAGAVWGVGVACFGLVTNLWPALVLLVLAGAADVTAVVFRTAIVAAHTPDSFRGRVGAAEYAVGTGCPQLGNFRAGAVATLTSPALAAVTGGLATVVGAAAIGLAIPALVRDRYQTREPVTAA